MDPYFPTKLDVEIVHAAGYDGDAIRKMIWRIRTMNGLTCPRCGSDKGAWNYVPSGANRHNQTFRHARCKKGMSPLTGTVFQGSKTPLRIWFDAIYDVHSTGARITCKQLATKYDLTHKTAWRIRHLAIQGLGIQLVKYSQISRRNRAPAHSTTSLI